MKKELNLNKETIAKLQAKQMKNVKGGGKVWSLSYTSCNWDDGTCHTGWLPSSK